MTPRLMRLILVAWLSLAGAIVSARAAGVYDIASMPYTINAPGHYRLVSSINVPASNTTPVITVNASSVLLDLNGFTIGGGPSLAPAISIVNFPDVTVQNGFIAHVRGAPAIHAHVVNVTIRDITFFQCDQPVQAATRTVIEGCLAWNGAGGISTNGVFVTAGDSVIRDCAVTDFRLSGSTAVAVGEGSRIEGVVLRDVVRTNNTAYALRAGTNSIIDRVSLLPLNGTLHPVDGNHARLRALVAHGDSTFALTGHTATESVIWGRPQYFSFEHVTHSIAYGGTSGSPGFSRCKNLFGVLAAANTTNALAAFSNLNGPWTVRRSLAHRFNAPTVRFEGMHASFSENLISTFSGADISRLSSSDRFHAVRDNHLVGTTASIAMSSDCWVEGNSLALTTGTNAVINNVTPITNPGNNFITDQPRANFVIY